MVLVGDSGHDDSDDGGDDYGDCRVGLIKGLIWLPNASLTNFTNRLVPLNYITKYTVI